GRVRARSRPVGGLRAQSNRQHAWHPAARLRQRADVCDAAFRRTARSSVLADWTALVVVPDRGHRAMDAERVEFAFHRIGRSNGVGHGCLLYVVDDAGDSVGAVPRGGALLMGLMGTAGTLSIQFVLPLMGAIYDAKKVEVAGGE